MLEDRIQQAAEIICSAKRVTAFTGAGISAESGIPPFRGSDGLWSRYDPDSLDIRQFQRDPLKSWITIREIFYKKFQAASPNAAHLTLVDLESQGHLHCLITQNIDNLHQRAGNSGVIEYHGSSQRLICTYCERLFPVNPEILENLPPICSECGHVLKPDFVFFGEPIPSQAHRDALRETQISDVWLIVGTTGEVYPAASLPMEAKAHGSQIIEINISPSSYTGHITDIFLQGTAVSMLTALNIRIKKLDQTHG